jgi:type II secretory pathway component PulF
MSTKSKSLLSSFCLFFAIIITFAYGLLLFIVPTFAEILDDMEKELNLFEQIVLNAGARASNLGFLIVPFLLLCLVSAIAWRIYCSVSMRRLSKQS